jgi:hypothetical protein
MVQLDEFEILDFEILKIVRQLEFTSETERRAVKE